MLTRRMFLSDVCMALAAAGCSSSERASVDRRRNSEAASEAATIPKNVPRLSLNAATIPGVLCMVDWLVAREKGMFSAEGLDVEFFEQDWSRAHDHRFMSAWVKGPAGPVRNDLIVVEYPNLQDMASGAMDYYVVAGEHSGCRQIVCPIASPVRTIADLRGKRIGLVLNEDSLIWEFLLAAPKTDTTRTQWVYAPFPAGDPRELDWVKEQFAAGLLDAFVSADPMPEILKADGVARLVASNTWTPPLNGWYCCMLAVRKELVDSHPDLPKSVTRAIRNAAKFVEERPAEAVALAVATGYMPPSTRQDLCARLLGEYVWAATGRIQQDLERYFALLIDAGRIPAGTPPRELVKRVYREGEA